MNTRTPAKIKSAQNKALYQNLPPAAVGINRIRHDRECSHIRGSGASGVVARALGKVGLKYPWLSRFYDQNKKVRGLPETVRYNGDKGHLTLANQWIDFVIQNNTVEGLRYIMRKQSGWRNYGERWVVEQLGFGGDYVVVTRIDGRKAYIQSYDNGKHPANYGIDFLQQFGVVYTDDSIGLPDCGLCYSFPIANPGKELWVDVDDLTFVRVA